MENFTSYQIAQELIERLEFSNCLEFLSQDQCQKLIALLSEKATTGLPDFEG